MEEMVHALRETRARTDEIWSSGPSSSDSSSSAADALGAAANIMSLHAQRMASSRAAAARCGERRLLL